MDWYYSSNSQRLGPVAEATLVEKIRAGEISPATLVWNASLKEWTAAGDTSLAGHFQSPGPPPLPNRPDAPNAASGLMGEVGVLTDKVLQDLRYLMPQFLMPIEEIRTFRWLRDTKFLVLAGVGLFPLLCLTMFDDIRSAYWALALYFSTLWALFLYQQFPSSQVTRRESLVCFFGTGLVSITLLLALHKFPPVQWLLNWADSPDVLPRFLGMFFGVAILEELCKAAVVFFIFKTVAERLSLQTFLFYGLMSGLGFGIYEGVSYQLGFNLSVRHLGTYYLLNVIRLTTLPFLHAIWTGMAGYFIGLSAMYPRRRHGLMAVAILIPAFLHALHNTFGGVIAFGVDFVSVLALMVYLRQSSAFEKACLAATDHPACPPMGK